MSESIKLFLGTYWRGIVIVLTPLILLPMVTVGDVQGWRWCALTLLMMAVYWVTECIPLPVTSFLPLVIFPLSGVMSTEQTCKCYVNDTVIMFLGSIMLAYAVEQSGLHIRLALNAVQIVGYSRRRQLLGISLITMFVSMWITNTAATSMMVPITFALLKIFENQNLGNIFESSAEGEFSTKLTTCYFCGITYSATIGGIGTLVGTATNLVHKGLFHKAYPDAPEYLTFIKYCIFAVPYMLIMEMAMYLWLLVSHMGLFRPNSEDAKKASASQEAIESAKAAVKEDLKKLGKVTYHEYMVIILFSIAILLFVFRSPGTRGWAIMILEVFGEKDEKRIKDSVPAMFVAFLMLLLPSTLAIFKYCTAKDDEDLPKTSIPSVLVWKSLNVVMPYSYMFLLGAGFALSEAAKKENTDLNGVIGNALAQFGNLPVSATLLIVIIFTVFVTNFASNVVVCNVLAPIAMKLAETQKVNPLWYSITAGFSASYCFMLPVGTPGNLIVQGAAKIRTKDMVYAGSGITVIIIFLTWLVMMFYTPIVFPDVKENLAWVTSTGGPPPAL